METRMRECAKETLPLTTPMTKTPSWSNFERENSMFVQSRRPVAPKSLSAMSLVVLAPRWYRETVTRLTRSPLEEMILRRYRGTYLWRKTKVLSSIPGTRPGHEKGSW
ncbi:hypothetical protein HN011_003537 [Eciton burchellii]|nr:hypothetical protein HN011_003537 [Eciton burchellii]